MQQQHQQYIDRPRRPELMNNSNKPISDDFYTKLQRVRLSTAASSTKQYPSRTAAELLEESKAFFVKSEKVLHNRQTLSTNQRITPIFRTAQTRRSPYQDCEYDQDQFSFDLSLQSSTSSTTNTSDCLFESVSVLSLSDQTTFDSTNSLPHRKRTVVPSSITIIERNARIIKWLFQLHKANQSSSFQCSE